MTDGRIVVSGLTKRYGSLTAVDDLSFTVEPGRVTGFLGPNGAGKTTSLRMLLNLVMPTAGTATIGGLRYADLTEPAMVAAPPGCRLIGTPIPKGGRPVQPADRETGASG